jgi:hypothetical protein
VLEFVELAAEGQLPEVRPTPMLEDEWCYMYLKAKPNIAENKKKPEDLR